MKSLDPEKHRLPDLSTFLAGEKRGSGTYHSMFPVDVDIKHQTRSKVRGMVLRVPRVGQESIHYEEKSLQQQLEVRDVLQAHGVPVIPTYRLVASTQDPRTYYYRKITCVVATDLSRGGKNKVYSPTNVSSYRYPFRPRTIKLPKREIRIENSDTLLEKAWACAKGASDAEYCLTNPDAFVFELDDTCNQASLFIGDYKHFRNIAGTSQEQALLSNCRMSQWAVDSMGPFTGIPEDEVLNFFK